MCFQIKHGNQINRIISKYITKGSTRMHTILSMHRALMTVNRLASLAPISLSKRGTKKWRLIFQMIKLRSTVVAESRKSGSRICKYHIVTLIYSWPASRHWLLWFRTNSLLTRLRRWTVRTALPMIVVDDFTLCGARRGGIEPVHQRRITVLSRYGKRQCKHRILFLFHFTNGDIPNKEYIKNQLIYHISSTN